MAIEVQIKNNSNFFSSDAYMRIGMDHYINETNKIIKKYITTTKMPLTDNTCKIKLDNFDSMKQFKIMFFDKNMVYEYNFNYKKEFSKEEKISITIDNGTKHPSVKINNVDSTSTSVFKDPSQINPACHIL